MTIDDIRNAIEGLLGGLSNISGIRSEEEIKEQYKKASEECMQVSQTVCLLKGDLSGIQAFIRNVNRSEDVDGGVAKRLRGRSFYVSAICDAVAYEIAILYLNRFQSLQRYYWALIAQQRVVVLQT